jgi:hypothetical protein
MMTRTGRPHFFLEVVQPANTNNKKQQNTHTQPNQKRAKEKGFIHSSSSESLFVFNKS